MPLERPSSPSSRAFRRSTIWADFCSAQDGDLTFTIAPIMLSSLVTDQNRSVFFSVMSAFYAIGMGLAPVASREALALDIPQWHLFAFATVAALAAAVLFNLAAQRLHQIPKKSLALSGGEKEALRLIFGSGAKYPLIMVFLGACIFSTMTNFQTTFAISRGLNFSVFFIWYTVAVIGARFLLSGSVSRRDPIKMTMALLATMCMALGLLMITRTDLLYVVSALILGLSYGLVYPSHPGAGGQRIGRARTLQDAGLLLLVLLPGCLRFSEGRLLHHRQQRISSAPRDAAGIGGARIGGGRLALFRIAPRAVGTRSTFLTRNRSAPNDPSPVVACCRFLDS